MTSNKEHGNPDGTSTLEEQVLTMFAPVTARSGHLETAPASSVQSTVAELNQAYSDMENLLASSQIATLFLDRSLNIKRFTPEVGS